MKKLLLSERWRPKTLSDMVLPQRIINYFKNGLETNVILHGKFGTGKTTLARILIGKYSKSNPYLELNASLFTSIDELRGKVKDFCTSQYFDLESEDIIDYSDKFKYVFLDEFDGVSKNFQFALKAFIETMSANYNVRFIFTTNHLDKIIDDIKSSRITLINFDSKNDAEQKELKTLMFKRIYNTILPEEGIEISKQDLANIINNCYPDFRKTLNSVQDFSLNRETNDNIVYNKDLINNTIGLVLNSNLSYKDIYDFIFTNFGDANIHTLLDILGREFIQYVIQYDFNSELLFDANEIVVNMVDKLRNSHDPLILGIATVGLLRKLYIS